MSGRLLGLNAGNPGGNTEIVLKAALRAAEAQGATVELVRLDDLRLEGDTEDAWWFWERLMDADGVIVSAPILSRTVPGRLKVLMDQLLGPNADRAIVEMLIAMRDAGEVPAVPFRLDERVLRPRVAGLIGVGGALTPQWKSLTLPVLHTFTFSMQTAVVDQFVISGTGTPRSVLLDDEALARAAVLGQNVAQQLGRTFEEAEYRGEQGVCPLCHLDVIVLRGRDVACATCGAQGELDAAGTVVWTDLSTSVITMTEKRAHYAEILETAGRHAKSQDVIRERLPEYENYHPIVRPTGASNV